MLTGDPVQVQKYLFKRTIVVACFLLFFSLINSEFSSAKGLIFGIIISLLIFRLNAIHIERALEMPKGNAINFIRNRSLLNYGIYFIVLFVSFRNTGLNFVAATIGLLLLKFIIIATAIIEIIKNSWQEKMDNLI